MSPGVVRSAPQAVLTPDDLAGLLPGGSVLTGGGPGWNNITVQRFRFGNHFIDVPAMCDHVVALQLGGPVLMEAAMGGRRHDRRWFESGQINLIPAGQESKRFMRGPSAVLTIHISPALVGEVYEEVFDRDPARLILNSRLATADRTVHRIGHLLEAEAASGGSGTGLMAETLGRALALHLLRHHSNVAPGQPEEPCAFPTERLRRVVEHMRTHLDEDLPLAELARLSGLSQSQFARAFRDAVGEPPHRYLVRLRIERGCHLLQSTRMSVIEIGMACGFQQSTHFATMFRKLTGLGPYAWRVARAM